MCRRLHRLAFVPPTPRPLVLWSRGNALRAERPTGTGLKTLQIAVAGRCYWHIGRDSTSEDAVDTRGKPPVCRPYGPAMRP